MPSKTDYLGHHYGIVADLKKRWLENPPFQPQARGTDVLDGLFTRKKPFYYIHGAFDFPGVPIKAFSIEDPGIRLVDVLSDLYDISSGDFADYVQCETGMALLPSESPGGPEMEEIFVDFLGHRTEEKFKKLVLPLSIPQPTLTGTKGKGCSKYSQILDVPDSIQGTYSIPPHERYCTSLVPNPGFTALHHDSVLCGQVMTHFFGTKLWIMCESSTQSVDLARDRKNPTLSLVREADELFVWLCDSPHFFILPPQCYHSVLTFETASHMGVRTIGSIWEESVVRNMELFTGSCATYPLLGVRDMVNNVLIPDLTTWSDVLGNGTFKVDSDFQDKIILFIELLLEKLGPRSKRKRTKKN